MFTENRYELRDAPKGALSVVDTVSGTFVLPLRSISPGRLCDCLNAAYHEWMTWRAKLTDEVTPFC